MNEVESQELNLIVNIPAELEQYRSAIEASLFYLSLGATPADPLPTGDCKSSRIKIRVPALTYLKCLTARFGSQRQAIINALAWASTQDESRRAMLENTVI